MTANPYVPVQPTLTPADRAALEARLGRIFEAQNWTFAKTMPKIPHFWVDRKRWRAVERADAQEDFTEAVRLLDALGKPQPFFKRTYWYFEWNGYKYWQMGYPPEVCLLINRAAVTR